MLKIAKITPTRKTSASSGSPTSAVGRSASSTDGTYDDGAFIVWVQAGRDGVKLRGAWSSRRGRQR